jgi:regulator of cell morphogenesis and NO signaling
MEINATTKIADIATKLPASMSVFERYGVDFCCGGQRSLEEALQDSGLQIGDVLVEIERAQAAERQEDDLHEDWSLMSPGGLVDHIEEAHHSFLRDQLPRAGAELSTVIGVHGEKHPELWEIGRVYDALKQRLESHLLREERHFFPAIRALEAVRSGDGEGTSEHAEAERVLEGLKELEDDHDDAGDALKRLRELTFSYQAPPDACPTFSGLYGRLLRLEADIHRHVHLENNILIPSVREMLAA